MNDPLPWDIKLNFRIYDLSTYQYTSHLLATSSLIELFLSFIFMNESAWKCLNLQEVHIEHDVILRYLDRFVKYNRCFHSKNSIVFKFFTLSATYSYNERSFPNNGFSFRIQLRRVSSTLFRFAESNIVTGGFCCSTFRLFLLSSSEWSFFRLVIEREHNRLWNRFERWLIVNLLT